MSGTFETRRAVRFGDIILGRYVVESVRPDAGRGGLGPVLRGLRTSPPFEPVSIKLDRVPEAEISPPPDPMLRLPGQGPVRRMASILRKLDHPSIARLVDEGVHEGRAAVVLGWVRGAPLAPSMVDRLRDDDRLELSAQLADAVAALHEQGVIHRDIKPSNIIVGPRGAGLGLTLIDFDHTVEGCGHVSGPAGTPGWASPEQATQEAAWLDHRCDLFSLGAVLSLLLSGRLPFSDSRRVVPDCFRDGGLVLPDDVTSHLPRPIIPVLDNLLRTDRREREISARDVVHELRLLRYRRGPKGRTRTVHAASASVPSAAPEAAPVTEDAALKLVASIVELPDDCRRALVEGAGPDAGSVTAAARDAAAELGAGLGAALRAGRPSAVAWLERVRSVGELHDRAEDPSGRLRRARAALRLGRLSVVEHLLAPIVADLGAPVEGRAAAMAVLGEARVLLGRVDDAARLARDAALLDRGRLGPLLCHARCALHAGDVDEARTALDAARALPGPRAPEARELWHLLHAAGEPAAALRVCSEHDRRGLPSLVRSLQAALRLGQGRWAFGLEGVAGDGSGRELLRSFGLACLLLLQRPEAEEEAPEGEAPLTDPVLRGWARAVLDALEGAPSDRACLGVLLARAEAGPREAVVAFVDAVGGGELSWDQFPVAEAVPVADALERAVEDPAGVAALCCALVLTHLGCPSEAIAVVRDGRSGAPFADELLARVLLLHGRAEEALALLPPTPGTLRGLALFASGAAEEGLLALREAWEAERTRDAARWLCAALVQAGIPGACTAIVRDAWERHGIDDSLMEWAIWGFVAGGRLEEAVGLAERAQRALGGERFANVLAHSVEHAVRIGALSEDSKRLRTAADLLLQLGRGTAHIRLFRRLYDEGRSPRDLDRLAHALQLAGSEAEAVRVCEAALEGAERAPERTVELSGLLARQLLLSGRAADATEVARRALDHAPEDATLWRIHSEAEWGLGHGDEALRSIERALELDPTHPEGALLHARALLLSGRRVDAMEPAWALVRSAPADFRAWEVVLDANRHAGAEELEVLCEQACAACPGDPRLHRRLARARLANGRPSEARRAARRALDLDPTAAESWWLIVDVLLADGAASEMAAAAGACADKGGPRAVHLTLGMHAAARSGDMSRAVELGVEAARLEPARLATWRELAGAWLSTGDGANAVMAAGMMERHGASPAECAKLQALAALPAPNLPRALAWADAAMELNDGDPDVRLVRGLLHLASAEHRPASACLEPLWTEAMPPLPGPLVARALALASRELTAALELDRLGMLPSDAEVLWWAHGVALLVAARGREAIEHATRAVAVFPGSARLHTLRALAAHGAAPSDVTEAFERAQTLDPAAVQAPAIAELAARLSTFTSTLRRAEERA